MAREESVGDQFARWGLGKPPKPPTPPPPGTNGQPYPSTIGSAGFSRERKYALAALKGEADKLAATHSGRNHALNESVFAHLSGFIHSGALSEDEVVAEMIMAGRRASPLGDHPFTDSEIQGTIRSALKGGAAKGTYRQAPPSSSLGGSGAWIDPPPPTAGGNGSGPPAGPTTVHDFDPGPLEADFWARPVHRQIFETALGRMCAPWAILAYCAARALTLVRPVIMLPPTIGSAGSLNWFAAVISASGGGKSIASDLAGELVPAELLERNLGSGEGMVGQFYRPATKTTPAVIHEAIMFVGDEGDTLKAMGERSGQDTMGTIRSGFSGGTLGHSYITKGRDFHLRKQSYRMTLVVNLQPARAGVLMHDLGGTPQRFMFFPGNDHRFDRAPDEDPFVAPLNLPSPGSWQYPRQLTIPDEARAAMRADRKARAHGEGDPLDGHALFCRAKLAFALTILDGRTEMTSEDWRLSGIAADVSRATRTWLLEKLAGAERDEAVQKGQLLGVTQAAATQEKTYETSKRVMRVLMRVGRCLQAAGRTGMTQREVHHCIASRDRDVLDVAIGEASRQGWIRFDATQGRWFSA